MDPAFHTFPYRLKFWNKKVSNVDFFLNINVLKIVIFKDKIKDFFCKLRIKAY